MSVVELRPKVFAFTHTEHVETIYVGDLDTLIRHGDPLPPWDSETFKLPFNPVVVQFKAQGLQVAVLLGSPGGGVRGSVHLASKSGWIYQGDAVFLNNGIVYDVIDSQQYGIDLTENRVRAVKLLMEAALRVVWLWVEEGLFKQETIPGVRVQRAMGKTGRFRGDAYWVVDLVKAKEVREGRGGGEQGPKRQHDVRSHKRVLRSGKEVIVRAHKRGNPALGVVTHDYAVKQDGDGQA